MVRNVVDHEVYKSIRNSFQLVRSANRGERISQKRAFAFRGMKGALGRSLIKKRRTMTSNIKKIYFYFPHSPSRVKYSNQL